MNCEAPQLRPSGDHEWLSRIETALRPHLSEQAYDAVLPALSDAIQEFQRDFGHPPPLRAVYWKIAGELNAAAPGADALRTKIDACHAIQHYCFQTLQSHDVLRQAFEAEGLTLARVATPIWLDWLSDTSRSPIEAAAAWLDTKHRAFGLGALFQMAGWLPEPVEEVQPAPPSAKIIDLMGPAA